MSIQQPIQLKDAIRAKGYTVKQLHERVSKEKAVSYAVIARYCRMIHSRKGDRETWEIIKRNLKEMKVEWRETP